MKRLIVYMAGILLLAGCSTTKHLPEGEILYTGQKKMIVENRSTTPVGDIGSIAGGSRRNYPYS